MTTHKKLRLTLQKKSNFQIMDPKTSSLFLNEDLLGVLIPFTTTKHFLCCFIFVNGSIYRLISRSEKMKSCLDQLIEHDIPPFSKFKHLIPKNITRSNPIVYLKWCYNDLIFPIIENDNDPDKKKLLVCEGESDYYDTSISDCRAAWRFVYINDFLQNIILFFFILLCLNASFYF